MLLTIWLCTCLKYSEKWQLTVVPRFAGEQFEHNTSKMKTTRSFRTFKGQNFTLPGHSIGFPFGMIFWIPFTTSTFWLYGPVWPKALSQYLKAAAWPLITGGLQPRQRKVPNFFPRVSLKYSERYEDILGVITVVLKTLWSWIVKE